jgi:TolB protein
MKPLETYRRHDTTHTTGAMLKLICSSLIIAIPLLAAPLSAQVEGIRLGLMYQPEYQPGLVVLPLATEGNTGSLASSVRSILNQDFDYSDRFEIREPTGAQAGDPLNLALWKERGADYVLQGSLRPGTAGGTVLRLVLHDAVYGSIKEDRAFTLPAQGDPNFRMAVHATADEVVRWVTGEPGVAATRIAFVLLTRDAKEVYTIDYDGENIQRLTNDGSIALSPAWSPDGTRIAYTSYRTGNVLLYERDLRTGRDRIVSDREGSNITPDYSPDGRTIAFATLAAGNTEIATLNGTRLEQHTRGNRFDSLSPSYSPDGRQFAFESSRLGEPQIYVMPVGGGEARLVSNFVYGSGGYNTSPDWSPKGRQIAYLSRIGGVPQIVVADLDQGTHRLLTNEGSNEDPSWAPDGRHIVFSSRDRDGGGLFVLDSVSGRIRPLLRGSGYGLPAWSPVLRQAELSAAAR